MGHRKHKQNRHRRAVSGTELWNWKLKNVSVADRAKYGAFECILYVYIYWARCVREEKRHRLSVLAVHKSVVSKKNFDSHTTDPRQTKPYTKEKRDREKAHRLCNKRCMTIKHDNWCVCLCKYVVYTDWFVWACLCGCSKGKHIDSGNIFQSFALWTKPSFSPKINNTKSFILFFFSCQHNMFVWLATVCRMDVTSIELVLHIYLFFRMHFLFIVFTSKCWIKCLVVSFPTLAVCHSAHGAL